MTDDDLIRRSKVAWHTVNTKHIALPIFSTDGTHLIDVAFFKKGHLWVASVLHEEMVELIRTAEVLRKGKDDDTERSDT